MRKVDEDLFLKRFWVLLRPILLLRWRVFPLPKNYWDFVV